VLYEPDGVDREARLAASLRLREADAAGRLCVRVQRMSILLRVLMIAGFWRVGDGDWYRNGQWVWRFWRPEVVCPWPGESVALYWPFFFDTLPRLQRVGHLADCFASTTLHSIAADDRNAWSDR